MHLVSIGRNFILPHLQGWNLSAPTIQKETYMYYCLKGINKLEPEDLHSKQNQKVVLAPAWSDIASQDLDPRCSPGAKHRCPTNCN